MTTESPGVRVGPRHAAVFRLTIASSVTAARRHSPGPYDFCPLHAGRSRATYSLDVPGAPLVGGWCQTEIARIPAGYRVTLTAHWDARRLLHRSGTMTLVYRVASTTSKSESLDATLIRQTGLPPP